MIDSILQRYGYTRKQPRYNNIEQQLLELKAKIIGEEENKKRAMRIISADIGDVEPTDEKARREYVASASNFYKEILEKKLMQLIAQIREEMDTVLVSVPQGMNRADYDNYLRGTSNAFKLLMDHYEMLSGEHLANITKETNE